jgi:hypothetical protein
MIEGSCALAFPAVFYRFLPTRPAMDRSFRSQSVLCARALARAVLFWAALDGTSDAQYTWPNGRYPYVECAAPANDLLPYPTTAAPIVDGGWANAGATYYSAQPYQAPAAGGTWIAPSQTNPPLPPPPSPYADTGWGGPPVEIPCPSEPWSWQVLPKGLIYHSYWAGVHEPRLGIVIEHITHGDSFWDGTAGGRAALLRYGTGDTILPQGWELDVEAAAMVRLTFDEIRDFETADYRVGVPLTYGIDNWQFKFEVYHLSSHLGDEFIIAHPGSQADRINYVRDEVVFGASVYPHPVCRLYGEVGYAFNTDGGSEPWELQFGTELSQPGPTGLHGTPFLAINGHLREEVDFGGDLSAQTGWLWRGTSGQVARFGFHYFNGKSSQFQTFDHFEQQFGVGLWYDF